MYHIVQIVKDHVVRMYKRTRNSLFWANYVKKKTSSNIVPDKPVTNYIYNGRNTQVRYKAFSNLILRRDVSITLDLIAFFPIYVVLTFSGPPFATRRLKNVIRTSDFHMPRVERPLSVIGRLVELETLR